jgi:phosphonate degradation associated HDIG domain protein
VDVVQTLQLIFDRRGATAYDGERREAVSALQHALQCAQLAEQARATPQLIVASLLHDIGHFMTAAVQGAQDDEHEARPYAWLLATFGAAVAQPVRWHVAAKRCLVARDPGYAATLSPASQHSLRVQGGPMDAAQVRQFEAMAHAADAVQLRRWDDLAKMPGRATPPLAYYLALAEQLQPHREPAPPGLCDDLTRRDAGARRPPERPVARRAREP